MSNSVLILYTSKKDKRASSSSSSSTTCTGTETNKTTTSTNRTGVSLSQSMPVRATSTDTPLSACDCDSDDNQLTTEQSNTEVDGEKEKRYGDYSHSSRNVLENSARDMFEYGRQMKWLTATMTQRLHKSESSDNNGSKKPGADADESEVQAKCEDAKKECVSQGSLEYHYEYYL